MAEMVRVKERTHRTLAQLSRRMRRPMGDVLDVAVERYRRELILAAADRAYADSRRSQARADDDDLWDATLGDGLSE